MTIIHFRCQTKTSASRSTLTSMSNGEIRGCWSAKITARRDANQRWCFFSMCFLRVLIQIFLRENTRQWWRFFSMCFLRVLITRFVHGNTCRWWCFFSMCFIRVLITRFFTQKNSSVCNFPDVAMCLPFGFPRPVLCSVAIIVCLRPLLPTAHKGPILYIFRHIKKAEQIYIFPLYFRFVFWYLDKVICIWREAMTMLLGEK